MTTKAVREIVVVYSTNDRFRTRRKFASVRAAQDFAHHWIGPHPVIGGGCAVSGDGVGKVTVKGATLSDLFPAKG